MSGFEAVGVALAIPGVVDLCIKYGQSLVRKYQSFKNYEEELAELVTKFEAHWANLKLDIEFFAKVQDRVEERHRLHFEKLVSALSGRLKQISLKIESISAHVKKIFRRAKFALVVRKSLEDAISGLADWHNLLQPLIFHLTRISDPVVDQRIKDEPGEGSSTIATVQNLRQAFGAVKPPTKDSVLFAADNNFWNQRQPIQYTSVEIHKIPRNGRHLLIDAIPCDGRDPAVRRVIHDVRRLAQVLRIVEPMKFGIPRCAGIVNVKDHTGMLSKIEMVFKVPQTLVNPRSLRSLLLSSDHEDDPINARIILAKRLARTVSFVHSGNFVHKNFRPETIIIFESRGQPKDQNYAQEVGFPLLVGFQRFRTATGDHTTLMGDTAWEKNIYRHPDRQGQFPEEVYKMEHDIYSLGVCLLEIALWKSFVIYDNHGNPQRSAESERLDKKSGYDVKDMLVAMAQKMIPKRLGNRYAEVTVSCLKCLDDDEEDDNWDHLDEEGISVGVSYIEKASWKR